MNRRQDDDATRDALRRAAARLGAPDADRDQHFRDLELLAELKESARTLAEVPDEVLERLVDQLGPEEVLQSLRRAAPVAATAKKSVGRIVPLRRRGLLAAAALVVVSG